MTRGIVTRGSQNVDAARRCSCHVSNAEINDTVRPVVVDGGLLNDAFERSPLWDWRCLLVMHQQSRLYTSLETSGQIWESNGVPVYTGAAHGTVYLAGWSKTEDGRMCSALQVTHTSLHSPPAGPLVASTNHKDPQQHKHGR